MQPKSPSSSGKASFFFLNKKLIRHYQLLKTWTAGIVLKGGDVGNILKSNFDITKSFVFIDKNNEIFLMGVYSKKKSAINSPFQKYKLLLHKNEILTLKLKKQQGKLTIIPTKIFFSHFRVKLEIALARRKQKKDQKAEILAKEAKKRMKKDLSFS